MHSHAERGNEFKSFSSSMLCHQNGGVQREVSGSLLLFDGRDRSPDVFVNSAIVILRAVLGDECVSLLLPEPAQGGGDSWVSAGELVDQGHPTSGQLLDLRIVGLGALFLLGPHLGDEFGPVRRRLADFSSPTCSRRVLRDASCSGV